MTQRSVSTKRRDEEALAAHGFERYVPSLQRKGEPLVTITATGYFGFSRSLRRTDAASGDYVTIYYARQSHAIAFNFTRKRPEGAIYTVRDRDRFNAQNFFRTYDLDPARYAGRYTPIRYTSAELGIDREGDSIVIELRPLR